MSREQEIWDMELNLLSLSDKYAPLAVLTQEWKCLGFVCRDLGLKANAANRKRVDNQMYAMMNEGLVECRWIAGKGDWYRRAPARPGPLQGPGL